jgi:hypothetical protein
VAIEDGEMIDATEDPLGALIEKILVLSKREAAIRQIDSAIEAFHRGDFDIAITLAGAADGMKKTEPEDLFQKILELRPPTVERKRAIANLNSARDWLKHVSVEQSDQRGFTFLDSGFFILLAAHKWNHESQFVQAFASIWYFALEAAAADGTLLRLADKLMKMEAIDGGNDHHGTESRETSQIP